MIARRARHRTVGLHVGEEGAGRRLDEGESDGFVDLDHGAAGRGDRRESVRFRARFERDDVLPRLVRLRFGGGLRSPGTGSCGRYDPGDPDDETDRTQTSNAHYSLPLVLSAQPPRTLRWA